MRAALLGFAAIAALTAGGALAVAAESSSADRAQETEALRRRAEDLARAASGKFGEVLKEERLAQAQGKKPAAPAPADGSYDPWSATRTWLERSNREYRSLVQRLVQGGEGASPSNVPPSTPAAKSEPRSAPVASKPAPAEEDASASDWVTLSSERFQEIMRKLAERAAPPKAEAGVGVKQSKPAGESVADPAKKQPEKSAEVAAPKPAPSAAPAGKADVLKMEEERKLAETRRAEASKREAEVKKTEEALRAEQTKKQAETKVAEKAEEAKRAAESK